MSAIFIDVKKVSKGKSKEVEDGSTVSNPHSRSNVDGELVVQLETIRADKIKSARSWRKSRDEELYVEGEITVIYFEGDNSRSTTPEMKINESLEAFSTRLNSIKVEGEQEG